MLPPCSPGGNPLECGFADDAPGLDDRAGSLDQRRRLPVEGEQRAAQHRVGVELEDRDALLLELLVQRAPVRGEVRPVRQARLRAQDLDDQDVARARSGDGDRPGQQVRPRPAVCDLIEDAFDPAVHQQLRCVAGVMG